MATKIKLKAAVRTEEVKAAIASMGGPLANSITAGDGKPLDNGYVVYELIVTNPTEALGHAYATQLAIRLKGTIS